jgi:hypothetical protein
MVTPRQYAVAGAFRTALETRLLDRSRRDASDLQRLRRHVAFDRLLARMFGPAPQMHDGWILKGGYALELRFRHARATKDLDLTVRTARTPGETAALSVAALRNRLAGITPIAVPALSAEQHWAEKLHAYTRPREGRINTRVKDLIDLILLIERETLAAARVLASVDATFGRRRTHAVPRELPVPPAEWEKPFAAMAEECELRHTPIGAHAEVNRFWIGLQR